MEEKKQEDYLVKMYSESYEQASRQHNLAEIGTKQFIHDQIETTLKAWNTSNKDDRLFLAKTLATNIAVALKDLADLEETTKHFYEQKMNRLEELKAANPESEEATDDTKNTENNATAD